MIHNMQRIQAILSHPLFCESLHKIQELERNRIYCKHGLPHLLDVARIASLMAAARQLDLPRDVIYAAALLHDIGKSKIPNEIIGKPGKLTDSEYEEIKKHQVIGYNLIKNIDIDHRIKNAVL